MRVFIVLTLATLVVSPPALLLPRIRRETARNRLLSSSLWEDAHPATQGKTIHDRLTQYQNCRVPSLILPKCCVHVAAVTELYASYRDVDSAELFQVISDNFLQKHTQCAIAVQRETKRRSHVLELPSPQSWRTLTPPLMLHSRPFLGLNIFKTKKTLQRYPEDIAIDALLPGTSSLDIESSESFWTALQLRNTLREVSSKIPEQTPRKEYYESLKENLDDFLRISSLHVLQDTLSESDIDLVFSSLIDVPGAYSREDEMHSGIREVLKHTSQGILRRFINEFYEKRISYLERRGKWKFLELRALVKLFRRSVGQGSLWDILSYRLTSAGEYGRVGQILSFFDQYTSDENEDAFKKLKEVYLSSLKESIVAEVDDFNEKVLRVFDQSDRDDLWVTADNVREFDQRLPSKSRVFEVLDAANTAEIDSLLWVSMARSDQVVNVRKWLKKAGEAVFEVMGSDKELTALLRGSRDSSAVNVLASIVPCVPGISSANPLEPCMPLEEGHSCIIT